MYFWSIGTPTGCPCAFTLYSTPLNIAVLPVGIFVADGAVPILVMVGVVVGVVVGAVTGTVGATVEAGVVEV